MAIITLTSDFGYRDHYVAAVKAAILSYDYKHILCDVTHEIESCNILQGAYVLRSVFRDFPEGTVHLIAVDSAGSEADRFLAVKLEKHYFVGCDNGFFSLLSDEEPEKVILLENPKHYQKSFPAKFILAQAAARLANGVLIEKLGTVTEEAVRKKLPNQLYAAKNELRGSIIHIDHYGNLITNIDAGNFRRLQTVKKGQTREFIIKFAREKITVLNDTYNSVGTGDCAVFFNSSGMLEISINQGNAAELLGLRINSTVNIEFV